MAGLVPAVHLLIVASDARHEAKRDVDSLAPCPITHSAVSGTRQATVQPSCHVGMGRQVQARHFAPGKDARHIEVGNGEVAACQVVASPQAVVEHA